MRRLPALLLLATLLAGFPALAQTGQEKAILEMTKDRWLSFRTHEGQKLVYFTHLESWRCGIDRVRYSIDSDALDRTWRLEPCDPSQPDAIGKAPYAALPAGGARSVSVELTYTDGTTSGIVRLSP